MVSFQDTLLFGVPVDGIGLYQAGFVVCQDGVQLQVTKKFDTRYDHLGRMFVRCRIYRYIGFAPGRRLLLKYHNLHRNPDEYIHRIYDPATGRQILYETLRRDQFPTFPEVLDELAYVTSGL